MWCWAHIILIDYLITVLLLQENNIELKKGVAALKVGPTQKQVHLSNGETINYEKLFIATGSQ